MGNSEATCSWQQNRKRPSRQCALIDRLLTFVGATVDYLTQVLSGWLLGGSGWKLGEYKNVAHCEKQ